MRGLKDVNVVLREKLGLVLVLTVHRDWAQITEEGVYVESMVLEPVAEHMLVCEYCGHQQPTYGDKCEGCGK